MLLLLFIFQRGNISLLVYKNFEVKFVIIVAYFISKPKLSLDDFI